MKEFIDNDGIRWRPVAQYEELYWVSENGDVYSIKRQKLLSPETVWNGYYRVKLYGNSKKGKHYRVHRLVAQAFIENKLGLETCDHIDGNKKNNCVSNLQWMSRSDNTKKYWEAKRNA